jgi:hypothetical protein
MVGVVVVVVGGLSYFDGSAEAFSPQRWAVARLTVSVSVKSERERGLQFVTCEAVRRFGSRRW